MKTNVMIKFVTHKQEVEILYKYNRGW